MTVKKKESDQTDWSFRKAMSTDSNSAKPIPMKDLFAQVITHGELRK